MKRNKEIKLKRAAAGVWEESTTDHGGASVKYTNTAVLKLLLRLCLPAPAPRCAVAVAVLALSNPRGAAWDYHRLARSAEDNLPDIYVYICDEASLSSSSKNFCILYFLLQSIYIIYIQSYRWACPALFNRRQAAPARLTRARRGHSSWTSSQSPSKLTTKQLGRGYARHDRRANTAASCRSSGDTRQETPARFGVQCLQVCMCSYGNCLWWSEMMWRCVRRASLGKRGETLYFVSCIHTTSTSTTICCTRQQTASSPHYYTTCNT